MKILKSYKRLLKILSYSVLSLLLLFSLSNLALGLYVNYEYKNSLLEGSYENIDNLNLYCRELGEGPPLLVIHDFLGSSNNFNNIIEELSKNFKVITVDLPGFGASDKIINYDYSKRNLASTLYKLMKKKGYSNFNVLGHSLGGEIALNMAYYFSKDINKLILIGSTTYEEPPKILKNKLFIDNVYISYIPQWIMTYRALYNKTSLDNTIFNKNFYFTNKIPGAVINKFMEDSSKEPISEYIKDINTKTLIIWGEKDNLIPIEKAHLLNKELRNSSLTIFDKAGHFPFWEAKEEFLKEVTTFLNNN